MKKRFDFTDPILSQLSVFDPHLKNKPNSLYHLIQKILSIVNPEDKNKIQKIDDEWRLYILTHPELPEALPS